MLENLWNCIKCGRFDGIYGLSSYAKDKNQLNFLVNTVQIFSLDIGIDNCGILEMKSGRYEGSEVLNCPISGK